MAVVGNKSHKKYKAQVTEEEAKKFADENDAIFMLVSSETGDGIEKLFYSIGKKFMKENLIGETKLREKFKNKLNSKLSKCTIY